ncbi:hypothetical protein PCANC_23858 [Puccinia coronata f. sp. avenae]|uniref:Uncharacterized protein n=1 Tax=Puccinia coronata f. sp. avenae TaxID=200324 RepID=A0A2N5TN47_9BASI|nr:hypothetical protein PCANC_23858 [Puccinia coronata f. sp. avenae]
MAGVDQSLGGTPHNGQCRLVIGRNSSQRPVWTSHWEELLTMAAETNGPGCRTGATPTGTSHKYPGTRLAGAGAGEGAQMS